MLVVRNLLIGRIDHCIVGPIVQVVLLLQGRELELRALDLVLELRLLMTVKNRFPRRLRWLLSSALYRVVCIVHVIHHVCVIMQKWNGLPRRLGIVSKAPTGRVVHWSRLVEVGAVAHHRRLLCLRYHLYANVLGIHHVHRQIDGGCHITGILRQAVRLFLHFLCLREREVPVAYLDEELPLKFKNLHPLSNEAEARMQFTLEKDLARLIGHTGHLERLLKKWQLALASYAILIQLHEVVVLSFGKGVAFSSLRHGLQRVLLYQHLLVIKLFAIFVWC